MLKIRGKDLWPVTKDLSQNARALHGPHKLSNVVSCQIFFPKKHRLRLGCPGTELPQVICGLGGVASRKTWGYQEYIVSDLLQVWDLQAPANVTDHCKTHCCLGRAHRYLQSAKVL